jgi:uncharacterized protein (TIGR03083 family)
MTEAHAISYEELRVRVTALVQEADSQLLEQQTPATPEWRVRDVIAHLSGVADDVVNGRLDGIASDAWTAAQVEKRSTMSFGDLLADWEQGSRGFEPMLAAAPMEVSGQALFDSFTHEHDIRNAIGRPGARGSHALDHAWEWFVAVRTTQGAPAIRFVTEGGEEVSGTGELRATVGASRFELVRATTGRRTRAEMERYEWDPAADPPILLGAPFFTIRAESLGE